MTLSATTLCLSTGVTLSYRASGDARSTVALVLLPGLGDSWRSWDLVTARLPGSIQTLAISQRGHVDSDKRLVGFTVSDFEAGLDAFLGALAVPRVVVVGHSSASLVARRFAERHPPTKEFLDVMLDENLKAPARVWRETFESLLDYDDTSELPTLRTPTLIIWGDRDTIIDRHAGALDHLHRGSWSPSGCSWRFSLRTWRPLALARLISRPHDPNGKSRSSRPRSDEPVRRTQASGQVGRQVEYRRCHRSPKRTTPHRSGALYRGGWLAGTISFSPSGESTREPTFALSSKSLSP